MNIQEHALFNTNNPERIRVYFVELDDDNRERVISAVVERASFNIEEDYTNVYSDISDKPFASYRTQISAELNMRIVEQDGVLFTHETWEDEEEE